MTALAATHHLGRDWTTTDKGRSSTSINEYAAQPTPRLLNYVKLADGKKVRGFPAMCEAFGRDVAARVATWLGYTGFENELLLVEMNTKYTVVQDGGKVSVLRFDLHEQRRGDGRVVHKRFVPTFISFGDFHNYYKNKAVWIDDGKGGTKPESLGKWWTSHPERRTVEGLTFRPGAPVGELVGGRLNLWRGFGVESAPGDWSLMQQHIKEVLAAGDEEVADYIENWLAWAVQYPAERAQVALVFKGGRGAGKGTLGNAMCHLFGQHATHISSVDHLAGRFNAHLRDAVFLFSDEAYLRLQVVGIGAVRAHRRIALLPVMHWSRFVAPRNEAFSLAEQGRCAAGQFSQLVACRHAIIGAAVRITVGLCLVY